MSSPQTVGIDLSLIATGIAVGDELVTITSKPSGNSIDQRTLRLADITWRISRRIPGDVELVVIEAPAFSRGSQSGHHLLAGLWWKVAGMLCQLPVPVVEVQPNVLKKFSTGRGNATKADMRVALLRRTGLDVPDDNQADAWWLRQAGLCLLDKPEIRLPKQQLDALKGLRAPGPDIHPADS